MSCETMTMSTPKKHIINGIDEMYLIEDIEKKLESFNHLLERSTEKEKGHIRRINEQAAALSTLQIENESLKAENSKLRSIVDSYMKNFVCFMENLKRTSPLEEENLALKQRLEQSLNETSDKIVDLELEKDQLQKSNTELNKDNDKLKKEVNELNSSLRSLNEYILSSFKQTIAYTREEKIKDLEDTLKAKDLEVAELKAEMEKRKEAQDKLLKQKTLEYELLKMDYQSAIVQNIQARQMNLKGDNVNKAKADKNDKSEKAEKHDKIEKSAPSAKNQNNRVFNIITTKPEETPEPRSSSRRTRGAYKKNTAIMTMKDEIENEELLDKGDEDFEIDVEIEDESFDEDESEEDTYVPKKGKRKARETKKKQQQTKKVKKNENKELLLVNRNAIQYHLFQ